MIHGVSKRWESTSSDKKLEDATSHKYISNCGFDTIMIIIFLLAFQSMDLIPFFSKSRGEGWGNRHKEMEIFISVFFQLLPSDESCWQHNGCSAVFLQ